MSNTSVTSTLLKTQHEQNNKTCSLLERTALNKTVVRNSIQTEREMKFSFNVNCSALVTHEYSLQSQHESAFPAFHADTNVAISIHKTTRQF